MNRRRRYGVVTGKNVAGENGERERLIARAIKIAAGKLIVFIERMIDLRDQAVDVVRSGRGDEEIRLAAIVEERQWPVRHRPWIASQQACDDWIRRATK